MLTFEEDDPAEPLELAVKQVVSVVKSAEEKVNFSFVLSQCTSGLEMLTFLISISEIFICYYFCTLDLSLLRLVGGCLCNEPMQTLDIDSLLL